MVSAFRSRIGFFPVLLLCATACVSHADEALEETDPDAIVNGTAVSAASVPSVVRLAITRTDGVRTGCTGSVLASRTVLTAAHCVQNVAKMDVVFSNGTVSATSFLVHPNYLPNWQPIALYGERGSADLAIVRLSATAPNSARVGAPSSLAAQGRPVRLVGFGATRSGDTVSSTPRAGQASVVRSYAQWFSATGPSTACSGDSGGPAFDSAGALVGVMVKARDACDGTILLQAAAYAPWIRANMGS